MQFVTAVKVRSHVMAALAAMTLSAAARDGTAAESPKTIEASALSATAEPATAWRLGATPLPLRRDGFGMVHTTPPQLGNRRLPSIYRLPSPRARRFEFTVGPSDQAIQAGMPALHPDCPVQLDDLAYITVSFWGFDGRPHTGEFVIHRRVATKIVGVFARVYDLRFPIEEMRLVTAFDLAARPTGDGNNTTAFLCRASRGGARRQRQWSAHAYGLAIDINPFQNPYRHGTLVLPELASAYLDRERVRPGMIRSGDVVTQAFAEIGWAWGGAWQSKFDYMHFSESGK